MITAWITDGSSVTFLDTHKLDTKVPKKSRFAFAKEKYEGLTDQNVFVGSGNINWQEGGHDAELEWVLIFDRPITEIEISEKTKCTLQGMIEGKNLAKLLGDKEIPWGPASIGNNVIATMDETGQKVTGGVTDITLGDLRKDNILASMHLFFNKEDGSDIPTREVHSTVLQNVPVVELLQELAGKADKYGLTNCRVVNLGANGENSAYVSSIDYQKEATVKELFSWEGLVANVKQGIDGIKDRVRDELIKELIEKKWGMGKGSEAHLQVFDCEDTLIGEAVLKTV